VLLDSTEGLTAIVDDRVDATARSERAAADRFPIGSPMKHAALTRMKHAELAARNQAGGFWVAAADPDVAVHALTGRMALDGLHRVAALTDGAARLVTAFELLDWHELLTVLDTDGLGEIIRRTRAAEASDPHGIRWPRNKVSDDATIAYAQQVDDVTPAGGGR